MTPQKEKVTLIVLSVIFLATTVFFAAKYAIVRNQLTSQIAATDKRSFNNHVLDFTALFIDKVLKAKGEVSFEERLNLETVVRSLNDSQILDQWNKFVNSKTEAQAQEEVKSLLELLVRKVRI